MSQLKFVFLDEWGRKFNIGLYHGECSGHLMVFCNAQILLIDFHVLSDKKYSFYLGDELCELKVEEQNGKFGYGLCANEKADTPLNRIRQSKRKQYWIQSACMGAAVFGLIAYLSWLLQML
jgi:hypothetical protein